MHEILGRSDKMLNRFGDLCSVEYGDKLVCSTSRVL